MGAGAPSAERVDRRLRGVATAQRSPRLSGSQRFPRRTQAHWHRSSRQNNPPNETTTPSNVPPMRGGGVSFALPSHLPRVLLPSNLHGCAWTVDPHTVTLTPKRPS